MSNCSNKSKGDKLEQAFSRLCHSEGTAVLISPIILRQCGAGQVDFCRIFNGVVEVIELKSHSLIAPKQRRRLRASLELLALILKRPVFLQEAFAKRQILH